ncbi:MAG TPA: alpha/beta hydrolase [Candidatus Saccharimonadales bacterium]
MKIEALSYTFIEADGVKLHVATGGNGMPLVLLHGFPETHLAWRYVAPELTKKYKVVCPDLRGYGLSDKPKGDEKHTAYSKRTMAKDIYELMKKLGHEKFAIVGHDRGGLVGFRLALDYPEAVTHLLILDVIPTVNMWESLQGIFGVFGYHQFFLAQPFNFPEKILQASTKTFLDHTLNSWCKNPSALPADIRSEYLTALSNPESIHAICEDYRAGAFVDGGHDAEDRTAGKKINIPVSILWQDPKGMELPFDPLKTWQFWAPHATGKPINGGHLLPEEKPNEVIEAVSNLLEL